MKRSTDVLGGRGGRAESRVLLRGSGLPAHHAALINAAMGHALDFEDTLDNAGSIHPGVSALAAGLAIADRRGGVSGRDLVLAITLGLDVSCRVALSISFGQSRLIEFKVITEERAILPDDLRPRLDHERLSHEGRTASCSLSAPGA